VEHTPLVGRAAERTTLLAVVEAAATGSPGAVVLHGEPGIGKTRLVANVMAGLESHAWEVMLARCLRFSSDGTAFLPIGRALSGWLGSANPQVRAEVLSGATDLAAILPELGAPPAGVTGGRLVSLLATVFDRVSTLHPLVIVVDDLQWCDASSLDLLAHLIAGFRDGQRVALLATYRDSELGPGHLVHEWVADMRRMPRVSVLPLARLGRVETATLVRRVRAANLDRTSGDSRPPDPDEVYDRSQGNPYLTELIAAGDAAEGSSLPDALLGPWHRLSGHARVLTQALAVGGGPVPAPILRLIVPPAGPQPGTLGEAITEASAAGIAVVEGGSVWFRHPLLAEVIAQTIDPVTAARFHDAYVTVLQSASGLNELVRMGLLGQHLERAGRPSEAFVASIRAAEEAAQVHATAEESTHLQRAARLWPEAQATAQAQAGELPSLLERTCLAANRAGHFAACQTLAPAALNAVDAAADPLRASRLLLRLPLHLDHPGAATPAVIADRRRAVELAQPLGDTDELAAATAALAHSEFWHGIPTGRARAEYAVVVAERVGSAVTRAVAHLVHSQFIWYDREGLLEADRAWRQLRAHGDVLDWGPRAVLLLNCLEVCGTPPELGLPSWARESPSAVPHSSSAPDDTTRPTWCSGRSSPDARPPKTPPKHGPRPPSSRAGAVTSQPRGSTSPGSTSCGPAGAHSGTTSGTGSWSTTGHAAVCAT
jgi:hypothetical protein